MIQYHCFVTLEFALAPKFDLHFQISIPATRWVGRAQTAIGVIERIITRSNAWVMLHTLAPARVQYQSQFRLSSCRGGRWNCSSLDDRGRRVFSEACRIFRVPDFPRHLNVNPFPTFVLFPPFAVTQLCHESCSAGADRVSPLDRVFSNAHFLDPYVAVPCVQAESGPTIPRNRRLATKPVLDSTTPAQCEFHSALLEIG